MRDAVEQVAPARLHWGLFHLPGAEATPGRRYGGVGLMIDRPETRMRATPADRWEFDPDPRVEAAARRYLDSANEPGGRPQRLELLAAPEAHCGLGSGTQLALAVGRVLEQALGREREPAELLARRVGRGDRSAVGIHGSERGGLIVDAGKLPGQHVAGLAGAFTFPEQWRVVLCFPEVGRRWHGEPEKKAFAELAWGDPGERLRAAERSAALVLFEMLPALHAGDFAGFAAAVGEFNARSGDLFAPVQGGRYADPAIAGKVEECSRLGFPGCGQSSWGPCVFALTPDEDRAAWLAARIDGSAVCGWKS